MFVTMDMKMLPYMETNFKHVHASNVAVSIYNFIILKATH